MLNMNVDLKKRKYDFILLGGILFAGCLLGLFVLLFSGKGKNVQIRVSGEVVATLPLSKNTTYEIQGMGGTNLLVIQEGEAWIEQASCPDGLCVKTGHIRQSGQSVICLPNRVVVEIVGADGHDDPTNEIDAVVG